MCPLNLQTGWTQRMSCMPVDTNGCLSFCVCCCFFVYSLIYHVMIIPPYNEMNYWAWARRGSTNTRSTRTFGSFLMMFRQAIGKSFSQICAKERVSVSLEAADEIIYIHQQDACPLLWFNGESGWQEHYCQMYIACRCLQYFLCWEHTPSHPERHANVGAGGSAPQQRAFRSLAGQLFWLWTAKFRF